jgi:hypothetical protein
MNDRLAKTYLFGSSFQRLRYINGRIITEDVPSDQIFWNEPRRAIHGDICYGNSNHFEVGRGYQRCCLCGFIRR